MPESQGACGGAGETAEVFLPLGTALLSGALILALAGQASAGDTFDRLESLWTNLHSYQVTIVEHEVMGDQTSDHELLYEFEKPQHAKLEVVQGTRSGSVIEWDGGDRILAYKANMSFFKLHRGVHDHDMTSLRGNSILGPNMGDVLACFGEHREALREHDGPEIEGEATDEIELPYNDVSCPDDPVSDKGVTLDVLDVSKKTGLILMRRRYEGDQVVERWQLKDYKIDPGPGQAALR